MKVIGFNGSPRKDGNTQTLMGYLLRKLKRKASKPNSYNCRKKRFADVLPVTSVFENRDQRCAVKKDAANEYIEKMIRAEGIVLGFSVIFSGCNGGNEGLDRPGRLCRVGPMPGCTKTSWSLRILFAQKRRSAYRRNHEPLFLKQRPDYCRAGP